MLNNPQHREWLEHALPDDENCSEADEGASIAEDPLISVVTPNAGGILHVDYKSMNTSNNGNTALLVMKCVPMGRYFLVPAKGPGRLED